MRKSQATFNEDDRQLAVPMNKLFPAHLVKLDIREIGNRFIYNPTFRIAEEAEKIDNIHAFIYKTNLQGENIKEPVIEVTNDGKERQKIVNGSFLVGREYKFQKMGSTFGGFSFLDEELPKGERWKNQDYFDICYALGIDFPEDKNGNRMLSIVEEEDIVGRPCYIRLGRVTVDKREKNSDGEYVTTGTIDLTKVVELTMWENGKKLTKEDFDTLYPPEPEEDEPPF